MLPKVKKVKLPINNFPTKWQTLIFRNYGYVSLDKLAATLHCDETVIKREAARMGLVGVAYEEDWEEKGYITIIRNNWYLLPYSQLVILLGISEERLEYILQNDDFLSVKLGNFKPACEEIVYRPLTETELEETAFIADTVCRYRKKTQKKPLNFFEDFNRQSVLKDFSHTRIVHGYLSPCGDAFSVDSETYLPDALLAEYAFQGINGIWLHGLLSNLSFYPFDERLSIGYERRREQLKRLVARCQKYGIKIYLYLNEPRAFPEERLGKYAHLAGRREDGYVALCFSRKEVQEYLYNAVRSLFEDVRGLGGIITITMSENMTHCHYRPKGNCPVCKNVSPQSLAASVNNVMAKALRDSGSDAELIANLWGWSPFMEWSTAQTLEGVTLLDKDISVMCVSEYDLDIEKGGVKSRIIDYSIGNPGPSEITRKTLQEAKENGHNVYAKIQTNNSWECSAAPYLPLFDLTYHHIENLRAIGVEDYMLTWTLGGYPSPMLGMITEFCEIGEKFSLEKWYEKTFGANKEVVHRAVGLFCEGFQEFPFSLDSLYYSPKTLGCANLWDIEAQENQSTMVCFAFDDYETWIKPYPIEIYLSQYEKLLKLWGQGCVELKKAEETELLKEIKICAETAYCHFKSDYLQTKFSYLKRTDKKEEISILLSDEASNTERLLSLLYQDAKVGYETSNHYFYSERNLLEKLFNIQKLTNFLENGK